MAEVEQVDDEREQDQQLVQVSDVDEFLAQLHSATGIEETELA